LKAFQKVWRGKITKKRGTTSSCVIPTTNPAKNPPNPPHENPSKKAPKIALKKKNAWNKRWHKMKMDKSL
jgi:hypothetical protein